VSITCNAGAGGGAAHSGSLNPVVGGNATGGDENWTGGGSKSLTISGTYFNDANGGGGVGFFGTGFSGGRFSGAGTGGDSITIGNSQYSGGGYGFMQYSGNTQGLNSTEAGGFVGPITVFGLPHNGAPSNSFNSNNYTTYRGVGVGAGGPNLNYGSDSNFVVAGLFGGGGTCTASSTNATGIRGCSGGRGGGGGATIHDTGNSGYSYAGNGGGGFVQIGYLGT
jgi:hypothetical protein